MNSKIKLLTVIIIVLIACNTFAQPPYSYNKENTGADCEPPVLPSPEELENTPLLPDPFEWSDGSGRAETLEDWECRRNEIMAEIERYEIGPKPAPPENVTATLDGNTITVEITDNGQTLTLTSQVIMPEGEGPFPIVIGMNSGTGSLPPRLFKGVIQIPFMHNQVVISSHAGQRDNSAPYFKLYPELKSVGYYSAWSWGISRLIDGIEIVQDELNANINRIAVTGCSYAGKMALFGGAFDERIALTIVQESGGGGINSWRVSETIGNVEKIDNTNYSWFKQSMKTEFQGQVGLLPHDHHELMAMIVPRALLVLGNPPFTWLGDESGYVACRAAEEVYKHFDISDRFGFSFRSGHNHCVLPDESYSEVQAFVDKFLFDSINAETKIRVHDFHQVDYLQWISPWRYVDPKTPIISIDSLTTGSVLDAPASLNLTTKVEDINNDVEKVVFSNNGKIISEVPEPPFNLTINNLSPGSYSVSAKAIDSEGLTGYSNVIEFTVKAPTLNIYKTNTPPAIDGAIDDVWTQEKVEKHIVTSELSGTNIKKEDLSGHAKVLWDDSCIYLLAEVTDDIKVDDSPTPYNDDIVEFYFDTNYSHKTSYDSGDVQFSFLWNDGKNIVTIPSDHSTEGIAYSYSDTPDGYIIEAKIPWETINGIPRNKKMGFDFMINDDDDGGDRDAKMAWNAPEDQAWQDASLFGTVLLKDEEIITGNKNLNITSDIFLYPNPANDNLFVKGTDKLFKYKIINMNGKILQTDTSMQVVPVKQLPKGTYMIEVISEGQLTRMKFLKK